MPIDGATHLFVYGTLRSGALLSNVVGSASEWRYSGSATVTGDLYDAGEYPALVLGDEGGRQIDGLLVAFGDPPAAFAALDRYEGVDTGLYVRRRCQARRPDGSELVVWVYEYGRAIDGLRRLQERSRSPDAWGDRFERRK